MAKTSTKVFILEVMGRHAGWIAAAGGLAARRPRRCAAHHPVPRDQVRRKQPSWPASKSAWRSTATAWSWSPKACAIPTATSWPKPAPAMPSAMPSWAAWRRLVAQLVKRELGYKYHWARGRLPAACRAPHRLKVDVEQAYAVGKAAVELALKGQQRRDAGHRAQVEQTLSVEDRRGQARAMSPTSRSSCRGTSSPRMASASLRRPPLSCAADPGRGLSALQRRRARIRAGSRTWRVKRKLQERFQSCDTRPSRAFSIMSLSGEIIGCSRQYIAVRVGLRAPRDRLWRDLGALDPGPAGRQRTHAGNRRRHPGGRQRLPEPPVHHHRHCRRACCSWSSASR